MRAALFLLLAACTESGIAEKPADAPCELAWFLDADGDGFGSLEQLTACEAPVGYSDNSDDCDDANLERFPSAPELCNGVDDNCDLAIDDGLTVTTWYTDDDTDGATGTAVEACVAPAGATVAPTDCDDANAAISPTATELCNGFDDDCDLQIDEDAADAPTWWRDDDADTWGAPGQSRRECTQPAGSAANDDDCDDTNATILDVCPPAPPAPIGAASCAQPYLYTAVTGQPELQVASAYEPDAGGVITVEVTRPVHMTLLLSSYEEVTWNLQIDPAVTLDEVLLNGYRAQHIQGAPPGVPITTRSVDQTGTTFGYACGYSWPYNGGGCDTNLLIAGTEAYSGLTTTGFVGCYTASGFSIQ